MFELKSISTLTQLSRKKTLAMADQMVTTQFQTYSNIWFANHRKDLTQIVQKTHSLTQPRASAYQDKDFQLMSFVKDVTMVTTGIHGIVTNTWPAMVVILGLWTVNIHIWCIILILVNMELVFMLKSIHVSQYPMKVYFLPIEFLFYISLIC